MNRLHRLAIAAFGAAFFIASASAQTTGTVTNHAFAIGKGAGHSGYTSLLCGSAQLAVGQSAADPICKTITGDVTLSAAGALTIDATKVTSAMLNADVFSTAHSWSGQQTFTAPVLGTPASGTLTNATGLPISTGVSGLGTGVATFLGTPSSSNLASAVTNETGSGALVFATSPTLVTPALGTPASGVLTNTTGLPIATGVSGLGTNIATFLATPSSANLRSALTDEVGTGAAYFVGGALGTPASGTATNLTGLPLSTGVTGTLAATNFPALTGDVTTTAGSLSTTLATVNSNTGSFGGAAAVPSFTVNGKGLITAAGSAAYQDGTNAQKGIVQGDGTTISCTAGVCTSLGGAASSVAVGTTTISTSTAGNCLYNNAGTLGDRPCAPKGYLFGLTLANNATDATNDIDIAAGEAADADGNLMVLAAGITKRLDAAWSVGSGNGGLDTGSIANTTYQVWLIQRSDTGVVDVLFSGSATAPTMPANYDRKRRIGSIIRSGGAILAFSQNGDEFLLSVRPTDLSNVATTSAGGNYVVLTVPANIVVNALFSARVDYSSAATSVLLTSPFTSDDAVSAAKQSLTVTSTVTPATGPFNIRTDVSSRIRARASGSGALLSISTIGWIDRRGRDG